MAYQGSPSLVTHELRQTNARLVKWYNRRLQNVGRGFDSLISRTTSPRYSSGLRSASKERTSYPLLTLHTNNGKLDVLVNRHKIDQKYDKIQINQSIY